MSNSEEDREQSVTGGSRATLVIALTIGLIVGAGAGSFVVGPLLAESSAESAVPSGPELEAACQALFTEWEIEMRPPAPAATYAIENLVLNPAGSGGTRFLMASVTFGMRDLASADAMTARDAEIRDIVLRILASKTVAELSNTATRSQIKEEMRAAVAEIIGQRALLDIYFPQFVIQ